MGGEPKAYCCCMTREHGDERSTNELGVAAEVGEAKVIFGTNFELVCRSKNKLDFQGGVLRTANIPRNNK